MKINEIEEKDERNQLIRSKAQAISGEVLHWLLMAGAWVCIFFDAPQTEAPFRNPIDEQSGTYADHRTALRIAQTVL